MSRIAFTVNGQPAEAAATGTALTAIRDLLGLKGTKLICGVGGCGACTVLVDGVPVEACAVAAGDLAGTDVVTVEGFGDGGLTRVQQALIAHDAVQCGFCTPGIVVEAEAFVARWRREHGTTAPGRDDVIAALDGHLCRCGAYPGIVAAVESACGGDAPAAFAGRPDAVTKVTGAARFTVDIDEPGTLMGRILRSSVPRAEVIELVAAGAAEIPGVRAVVDLLGGDRVVRYVGQPIAAVAATDDEIADRALQRLEVVYRELPSAVGMEAARAAGSPDLIGRRLFLTSSYEAGLTAATIPRMHNMRGPMGLLAKRRFTARRLIRAARRRRDPLLVEGVWHAGAQAHASPEPHAARAVWDGDRLTLHLSTQSVHATARKLARHFDLPPDHVTVLAEHVGGGFGSKQGLTPPAVAAAELARAAGSPVKVTLSPSEELAWAGYRPSGEIRLSLLGAVDGRLMAIEAAGYHDGGDSAGQTVVGLIRLSHPGPPMSLVDYDVVTSGAPASPFQAPGAPFAMFALETAVDELAARLGRSPIALRQGWSPRPARVRLYDWAGSHPLWTDRRVSDDRTARGVGVAFGSWHYAFDPATVVRVTVTPEGLRVQTATQDIGTGSRHTLATAVAGVFGVAATRVAVEVGDSRFPHGPTSSASRSTPSLQPAAAAAAAGLLEQLVGRVATDLGMPGAAAVDGGLVHAGEHVPWADLWPRLAGAEAVARRPPDRRPPASPMAVEGVKFGWGISDAAHLAQVEIERATGQIRVVRMAVAIGAGVIHSPVPARSQVHGAVARGVGQALYEERVTDAGGRVVTDSYDRYRIMRMSEMPVVDVEFLEEGFDHAAGGGAGIAELAITAVPAAVANAVTDAIGFRPRHIPIRAPTG